MDWLDAMSKIIVGLFALIGVGLTGWLGWKQFSIKRADEQQSNNVRLQIDNAVSKLREEIMTELDRVSVARSNEGAERFKTHAVAIEEVNKQIAENSKQIGELTTLTKDVLANMDSINKVVTISAESQRNSNYDRLLFVTNKILKSGKMTIADKTNLRQLFESWQALKGDDPKMITAYEECMKITPTLEEGETA